MENTNCPKCNVPVTKHWINKRRQHMGKCGQCGKLVYLGRPTEEEGNKETGEKKTARPAKRATVKPAATGNRRAAAGPAKRTGTAKPDKQDQRPVQQPETGTGSSVERFIRDVWKW